MFIAAIVSHLFYSALRSNGASHRFDTRESVCKISWTLKRKVLNVDDFFLTGCTGVCHHETSGGATDEKIAKMTNFLSQWIPLNSRTRLVESDIEIMISILYPISFMRHRDDIRLIYVFMSEWWRFNIRSISGIWYLITDNDLISINAISFGTISADNVNLNICLISICPVEVCWFEIACAS